MKNLDYHWTDLDNYGSPDLYIVWVLLGRIYVVFPVFPLEATAVAGAKTTGSAPTGIVFSGDVDFPEEDDEESESSFALTSRKW